MKHQITLIFVLSILLASCQSTKSVVNSEKRKMKLAKIDEQLQAKQWKASFDVATPLDNQTIVRSKKRFSGGLPARIPLTGSEYILIDGDTIDMALSYFGTYNIGANFSPAASKEFRLKGNLMAYESYFDQDKNHYALRMKVLQNREELTLLMKFYANSKTVLTVNSNHRTSITYSGTLRSQTVL